ncbi:MAG: membrane protein insertase YidC [Endomicrobium sp.]|jgi:YidC/Oxa1 family membrane protein insertase|nr:membrane protein insertase YidC [Endomicrobium sp.]
MNRDSVLFVILSITTILAWFFFFEPHTEKTLQNTPQQSINLITQSNKFQNAKSVNQKLNNQYYIQKQEKHINITTEEYKTVLTNKGAAILSWSIKEKNGQWVDLVLPKSAPVMGNFSDSIYKIVSQTNNKIVFEHDSHEGWKITKTYTLSNDYMHNLNIIIEKTKNISIPSIELEWGPGLGTDDKELKENISLTRALAYTTTKPNKLKKLNNNSELAHYYKWVAIDNRYFLAAFIPEHSNDFDKIISSRLDKKHPYSLTFMATVPDNVTKKEYNLNFYLGPKGYTYLKTYNLGLEKTIDFGFFGFLGKIAFMILTFFYKLTLNYGWAIIIITAFIQILVLPLTLKGLKSSAAMKHIQPIIKDIQIKYKNDPKRLQAEMLNIYRTQKVNPLGGCLPMILQLPIFWAFFTMLRNAYELRNEGWILWIKDLSAADQFMRFEAFNLNLLPLIMGICMFFQQKMTVATSDPMQKRIMYIMPILFTFMFWAFPSGLVIYWITNNIFSMIEQYFILRKDSINLKRF